MTEETVAVSGNSGELRDVMRALRAGVAGARSSGPHPVLDRARVRALDGGRNNAICGCTLGSGEEVCVKLHRPDGRQRARREWDCLQLLAEQFSDLTPSPLMYEAEAPEATAMTYLPGERLDGVRLSVDQVGALGTALRELHAVTPASTRRSLLAVRLDEHGLLEHIASF